MQYELYWEDALKIVVFGLGDIYSKVKHYFCEDKRAEIVALVDNNRKLIGTLLDGHEVDDPENIQRYSYDYIVITSAHAIEMRQQLIEVGVRPDTIVHFRDYIGSLPVEVPVPQTAALSSSVLILSNDFGYHGGAIAGMKLARILRHKGYRITFAVPSAEQGLLEETSSEEGIEIFVIKDLDFLSWENLEWTREYTYVFANTFVMARCAIKLAQKRKVYLWLHESIDSYVCHRYWYEEISNGFGNDRLIVGAVSDVARKNFLSTFHVAKEIGLLPYGIEDRYRGNEFCADNTIITFTVVANHVSLKGLDVFLDAVHLILGKAGNPCRFILVGKTYNNEYGKRIRDYIDKTPNCEYLGELSREKMFEVYSETDIVIIPSRRDSLPLVATEAMMLKKPCIISDAIGTARYIKHKFNGLIFENENREELAEAICWCMENREALKGIAENARKTYETWFSMEKFGDRVLDVIGNMS